MWRTTAEEVAAEYACDRFVDGPSVGFFRAADSAAKPEMVFRWFCQLRIAPYSYDLLDHWGKPSPRTLSPGLDELESGQRFMTIFRLVDFTPGRQLTLQIDRPAARRLFGNLAVSYTVSPAGTGSRLVVKLAVPAGGNAVGRYLLAWGDLLMMRKQTVKLAGLAAQAELDDCPSGS
ncbi:hypothetical protein F1D05_21400 [Kribbella qitaiheensis]|uniref:SRPBCC family protein n=1 Tax=Kribbella qitaiheensis TaxID=1544730 RepID=A0A7G6XA02_9ACTN|nr:hypothetical protein F1D05_21400 [Kribbella qitaiheensis]